MLIITKSSGRQPGALCRIRRVTTKRFYIEVVQRGNRHSSPSQVARWYDVERNPEAPYVNRDDVWVEDVTEEQYIAYLEAHELREERIREATAAAYAEYHNTLEDLGLESA